MTVNSQKGDKIGRLWLFVEFFAQNIFPKLMNAPSLLILSDSQINSVADHLCDKLSAD